MTLYDVVQWLIIGGAVFGSAVYMLGRLLPGLRVRCGAALLRSQSPRLAALGTRLTGAGGGCGSGCSSCNSCGSSSTTAEKQIIAKAVD